MPLFHNNLLKNISYFKSFLKYRSDTTQILIAYLLVLVQHNGIEIPSNQFRGF
jgi:hypothetical protein